MSDDIFNLLMDGSHFESSRETFIKPPFAWVGGKSRSREHILPHLPKRPRYSEPCGGSGAILLARQPSKFEIFNDAYAGVTDFYLCLKDEKRLTQLIDYLELSIFSRELFITYKDQWKNTSDPVERAAKWYYMLANSFGGLGRNFGRGTDGGGSHAQKLRNSLKNFWPVHNRFKNVTVENMDVEQFLKDYDHHDMVFYVDPPYLHSDPGIYEQAWPVSKHVSLLQALHNVEGFVALSGYDNELYNSFTWDKKITWETIVTVGGHANTETNNLGNKVGLIAAKATECLWIKEVK